MSDLLDLNQVDFEYLGPDDLNDAIETIDDANIAFNRLLDLLHTKRRELHDGTEAIGYPPYNHAVKLFQSLLSVLPKDASSISIIGRFPKVAGEPKTNMQHELRETQRRLALVIPDFGNQGGNELEFELIGKSDSKTIALVKPGAIHCLEFRAHGIGNDFGSLWQAALTPSMKGAIDGQNPRIPLLYVSQISLSNQMKRLTPWADLRGNIHQVVQST